jgi:hypothetical protein
MKRFIAPKILLGLTIASLFIGCAPNTTTSGPGNATKPSAPPVSSDVAKPGSKSDAKLETFSSDVFKLTFKLPSDMKIKTNSTDHFEADNNAVVFQLFPWKDARLNEADILTFGLAAISNIDQGSFVIDADGSGYVENLGGYWGFLVTGTAKQGGSDIYVGMLGLIDPNTNENYISYLTLDKNKNTSEDSKNLNVGADIFLSFTKK